MLLSQRGGGLAGFVPRLLQWDRLTTQGAPGSKLSVEAAALVIDLRVIGSGGRFLIGPVFGDLVLIELALDQATRIGARPDQIFLGVVRFVPIEFQLGLGYVKLFL